MGSLIALLCIVSFSLLIVRIGATALSMTGLSWDASSFQAYSAFFGVGFTTREAEMVVNHPTRRRIIRDLILAGNVGITSALATIVVTFVQTKGTSDTLNTVGLLVAGALGFYLITRFKFLDRMLTTLIRKSLQRSFQVVALDYELLLHMKSGFCVSEIEILPGSPLASRTLRESRPSDRGIVVLGITDKNGHFRGAPSAEELVQAGETATVYGSEDSIQELVRLGRS